MISLDGLPKAIDPSQLTREFDGTLEYEHEQWIQLRLVRETAQILHFGGNSCNFEKMNKWKTHVEIWFNISLHLNLSLAW